MKILGIVGSPHKGGNTEILTQLVLKGAKESGAEIELIRLVEFNLNYCRGCHQCLKEGVCAINDDAEVASEKRGQACL